MTTDDENPLDRILKNANSNFYMGDTGFKLDDTGHFKLDNAGKITFDPKTFIYAENTPIEPVGTTFTDWFSKPISLDLV